MFELAETTTRPVAGMRHDPAADLWNDVVAVCRRIPPLWPLGEYVAVNPFLGFAGRPLAEAARIVRDGLGGQVLPGIEFYRARWRDGAFGAADIAAAAVRAGHHPTALQAILAGAQPMPTREAAAVETFAEQHDRRYGGEWSDTLARHTALWCAAHAAQPATCDGGLFATWRAAAPIDRSLEIAGLEGWRSWARELPSQPLDALAEVLARRKVPGSQRTEYLYRLLAGVYGWAAYLRREAWQHEDQPGAVLDLLAIRACADAAVAELAPRRGGLRPSAAPPALEDEATLEVFQDTLEQGYARRLLGALNPPAPEAHGERPAAQAIFCIDVRSEPLRRHLEAQAPTVETRGFAGFFGVSIDWASGGSSSARCPVLLSPAVRLEAPAANSAGPTLLKHLLATPAAFSVVETLGAAYGLALAGDALRLLRARRADEGQLPIALEPGARGGIALGQRLDLAAGMLKNMGMRGPYARLVLLCGHAGQSENNPHAAGLDCGACGGHGGQLNARVAAALLNDPAVRAGLPERGFTLPDDTWFVPAVHDTTTDAVRLLDRQRIPASHQPDIAQLEVWLERAGAATRAERAPALGVAPRAGLGRLLRQRARDWSETRPEWGLARNAAFIAAPRARTRGVDLQGRAFLHEYDWSSDHDGSILTLILSAPMVVASWINWQYFASTVDNRVFGCGSKALHNRIGELGVVLGNGGDLRTGLAAQSVYAPDGSWYHEPLRLHVIVEAPCARIERVLEEQPRVRALFENGWVRLFALDPARPGARRWMPWGGWATA